VKGKVSIVTGASQGIGRAIAEFLAQVGSHVAIFDVLDGGEALAAIEAKGVKGLFLNVDVTDYGQVDKAVQTVIGEMGGIDNLVNNAGITKDKPLVLMSEDDWDRVIRVNLKGVFICTKIVVRHMLKKGGSIVNIASLAGLTGNPGQANYAASKAGIIGFTKTVAREYGKKGIRVNAVAPGFIKTGMTEAVDEKTREAWTQEVPLQRPGEPVDVARVVYFLLSDYSSYVTGEVINVSGGLYT
jgi:3-oxoacyl-[acyl-carrier protein] reductase